MDRVLREERAYILNIVKQVDFDQLSFMYLLILNKCLHEYSTATNVVLQIKKAGCNVLLIQKSILRDALSDLAIHFFDKMKIMVVKNIEREDIDHVCKTLG